MDPHRLCIAKDCASGTLKEDAVFLIKVNLKVKWTVFYLATVLALYIGENSLPIYVAIDVAPRDLWEMFNHKALTFIGNHCALMDKLLMFCHVISWNELHLASRAVSNYFATGCFSFVERSTWEPLAAIKDKGIFACLKFFNGLRFFLSELLLLLLVTDLFSVFLVHFLSEKAQVTGLTLELSLSVLTSHLISWLHLGSKA